MAMESDICSCDVQLIGSFRINGAREFGSLLVRGNRTRAVFDTSQHRLETLQEGGNFRIRRCELYETHSFCSVPSGK